MNRRLIVEWSGDRVQIERVALTADEAVDALALVMTGVEQIDRRSACATASATADDSQKDAA